MFPTKKPNEDWELSNPYWIAVLSNNEVVYGDSNDPSENPVWSQLKDYTSKNKLRVVKVILKFRSHEISFDVPPNSNWLYFAKAMGKEWTEENTDKFFVIGLQDTPSVIKKSWYKLPELTLHKDTASEIRDCKEEFLLFQPVL